MYPLIASRREAPIHIGHDGSTIINEDAVYLMKALGFPGNNIQRKKQYTKLVAVICISVQTAIGD